MKYSGSILESRAELSTCERVNLSDFLEEGKDGPAEAEEESRAEEPSLSSTFLVS